MNGTLVIAARELRANTRIFIISAVLAVWPFLASLLPTARGHRAEVIVVLGGFLSVAVGLGLAVALGISTIGRELSERRLSFYFSKPVSPAAIWFGKAGAAIVTSVLSFALIALPTYFTSPQTWRLHWLGDAQPVVVAALVIAALFFLSHFLSSILRSRSAYLAFDVIALLLLLAGLYAVVRPLALGGAGDTAKIILVSMGAIVAGALVVGPVWQLANGRTDAKRGHAALSRAVWSILGGALLLAGGYVAWLISGYASDLKDVHFVEQPGHGTAFLVSGTGAGRGEYVSTFLIDQRKGDSRRLSVPKWWGGNFSEDGTVYWWLQPLGLFNFTGLELYTIPVAGGSSVASGITMTPNGSATLSSDGSRVVVVDGALASVFDLATGKLLASGGGLDFRANHVVIFLGPDLVRIVEAPRDARDITVVRVYELDVRRRTMSKTGEGQYPGSRGTSLSLSGDGSRILVRGISTIADGRTAGLVARLNGEVPASSAVLYDGTVATITPNRPRLQLYSRDGLPLHDIPLPDAERAFLSGEIEEGKLIVAGSRGLPGKGGMHWSLLIIDVRRGVVERVVPDVLAPLPRWQYGRLAHYTADQKLVVVDLHETLYTLDPRTGALQKVKLTG
ncbi:MAG: hypothetical protein ABI779_27675 [Acidobacteriota bacterium]